MKKEAMINVSISLQVLKLYLVDAGLKVPLNVRAKHDPKCDKENESQSRRFCFVKKGSQTIHCAAALEIVPEFVRMGILLHELAHLSADAFGGTAEIDADSWILKNVSESGFMYQDVGFNGQTLKAIETVSPFFLRKIHERFEVFSDTDHKAFYVIDKMKSVLKEKPRG